MESGKNQQRDGSASKPDSSSSSSHSFLTPSQAMLRRSNSNTNTNTMSTSNSGGDGRDGMSSSNGPSSSAVAAATSATATTTTTMTSSRTTTAQTTNTTKKTLGPSWLLKHKNQQNNQKASSAATGYGAGGGTSKGAASASASASESTSVNDHNSKSNKSNNKKKGNGDNNTNTTNTSSSNRRRQRRRRGGRGGGGLGANTHTNSISSDDDSDNNADDHDGTSRTNNKSTATKSTAATKGSSSNNRRKKNRNNKSNSNSNTNKKKKSYPWRSQLKDIDQEEDPITLDRLDELEYPPFVLCRNAPYVPVPVWPIPPGQKSPGGDESEEMIVKERKKIDEQKRMEELNRQRLAEQWGTALLPDEKKETTRGASSTSVPTSASDAVPTATTDVPLSERKFWFFDGRALALYMVKQLQFVNPFDRRDLTRPELVNLDEYLKRHRLDDTGLNVTEAYDAKGVSLSSAGAAAHTAEGRAQIMREMAEGLYNSLFSGGFDSVRNMTTNRQQHQQQQQQQQRGAPTSTSNNNNNTNSIQEQYAAMQLQEQRQAEERRRRHDEQQHSEDGPVGFGEAGIYGSAEEGGFMIIDDDQNPGLRGRGVDHDVFPSLSANTNSNRGLSGPRFGSSRGPLVPHFDGSRITSMSTRGTDSAFPALSSVTTRPVTDGTSRDRGGTATVTTINQASGKKIPAIKSKTLNKIGGLVKKTSEQERQRQYMAREEARKKAMMANLSFGMTPSTQNPSQSLLSAPPQSSVSSATEQQINRNRAFADALGVTPATDRHYTSGWARPVNDDRAKDEFGQELGAALYPETLISQAKDRMQLLLKLEKKWKTFLADDKAASLPLNHMDRSNRAFVHEYAEFWNLKTESFDPEPKRYIHCVKVLDTHMPYPLLSTVTREWRGPLPDTSKLVRLSSTDHAFIQTAGQSTKSREKVDPPQSMGDLPPVATTRLEGILGRERPKLELAPRTLPTELPPFEKKETESEYDVAEDLKKMQARAEDQRRKEQLAREKQQQILQEAFASDDEDSEGENHKGSRSNDDDSDWGEDPTPLYQGDDDE